MPEQQQTCVRISTSFTVKWRCNPSPAMQPAAYANVENNIICKDIPHMYTDVKTPNPNISQICHCGQYDNNGANNGPYNQHINLI